MRFLKLAACAAVLAAATLLSGCETLFPRTSAGFEEDGLVGAVKGFGEGAAEIGPVVCATLDGATVTVVADVAAEIAGKTEGLAGVRSVRRAVCATFGAVPAPVPPVPVPAPRAAAAE